MYPCRQVFCVSYQGVYPPPSLTYNGSGVTSLVAGDMTMEQVVLVYMLPVAGLETDLA